MRKINVLLITVLLISCSPVKKYQSLPEVLAWEPDIQKFEQLDRTEKYPPDALIFTGSSSIRMWSTLSRDMAPYPVIQRGFGGSRLSDFAVYQERILAQHPCGAIVIFIANDIAGNEKDKSPEETADLFHHVVKKIRKTHKDTPVFWIEITPTPSRWKVWPQINEANNLIKEICEKMKDTYYISTSSVFLDDKGLPKSEYFRTDMLHLNEDGYRIWNAAIKKELNKIIPIPEVEIIAHRGASYDAPENTVASAKLAWERDADAVECDIHLSGDGRIVVSHDAGTKRTSGKELSIKTTASSDLRKLDVGSFKNESYRGEKIPFLEEIIATVPAGKELVVEIKCGPEVLPELKKVISGSPKDVKFAFIAFDFNTISETKKTFPENPCYWLCSNRELLKKNLSLVNGVRLEGLSLSYNIINEDVVKQVKELGLELYTWTVDNPDEARRLIALGVKGITTNRPDYIREQVYGQ